MLDFVVEHRVKFNLFLVKLCLDRTQLMENYSFKLGFHSGQIESEHGPENIFVKHNSIDLILKSCFLNRMPTRTLINTQ